MCVHCPLHGVRPLTLCPDKDKEFPGVMTTTRILMRSQFHIPFVPSLWSSELKYDPWCQAAVALVTGTGRVSVSPGLLHIDVVCSAAWKYCYDWDAKWPLPWNVLLRRKCKNSAVRTTISTQQPVQCQLEIKTDLWLTKWQVVLLYTKLGKNCIYMWFRSDVFVFSKKCEVVMTVRVQMSGLANHWHSFWLVSPGHFLTLVGWPSSLSPTIISWMIKRCKYRKHFQLAACLLSPHSSWWINTWVSSALVLAAGLAWDDMEKRIVSLTLSSNN